MCPIGGVGAWSVRNVVGLSVSNGFVVAGFLQLSGDPSVRFVGQFGQSEQVVAAEAVGSLPADVVLVQPAEGDAEVGLAFAASVLPDGGGESSDSELVNGLVLSGHVFLLGNEG